MSSLNKVFFFLILIGPFYGRCDHASGGYFEYTCISSTEYKVDFYFLRDCQGIAAPSSLTYSIGNICGSPCNTSVTATLQSLNEVDFGCGNGCISGSTQANARSYQLAKYSANVYLTSPCSQWRVSVSIDARNLVNYATHNSFGTNYYNYCIINNESTTCNSSVKVTGTPFAVGCVNSLGGSLHSFTNPDGSTLTYSLVSPLNGTCTNYGALTFLGGASPSRPFPSTTDFAIDQNGGFSFNPTLSGESYFALEVREYNPSGLFVGLIRLDGIVFVSNACQVSPVSFSNWSGLNSSNINVSYTDQDYCSSINVSPINPNEIISEVLVDLDDYMTVTNIFYNANGSATVEICANFPIETQCQSLTEEIKIVAKIEGNDCISQEIGAGGISSYTFTKPAIEYCPYNLYYTNRNNSNSIAMPTSARAENEIWIGDMMPTYAPPYILNNTGHVDINNNIDLVAGAQINLPSCQGGGVGCVTITGNVTLEISPQNCSIECTPIPLQAECSRIFNCFEEKLAVNVTSGQGPFSYVWSLDGQFISTTVPYVDVHNIVSNYDGTQLTYYVTVTDGVGQEFICGGLVWGTKRFYENIQDNVWYLDYPPNSLWEDGYYYDGQPGVDYTTPFHIIDNKNLTPPWYGATHLYFRTWSSNGAGETIYEVDKNLENLADWSFDNGELYWNGFWNNDPALPCAGGSGSDIFNYILKAENCVSAEDQNPNPIIYPHHEELSALIFFDCTDSNNPWTPDPAKSISTDVRDLRYDYQENVSNSLLNEISEYSLYPNPTNSDFLIAGDYEKIQTLRITDNQGKVILLKESILNGEKINIQQIVSGIYGVEVIFSSGVNRFFKLIKH